MNITNRMKRSIANRGSDVFLRADFQNLGSPSQVTRALSELQNMGVLVKLGVGAYAKAKRSVLSGEPIPVKPLEVLAPEVLKLFGVRAGQSRQTREYNTGASTQVPIGIIFNTDKKRIRRKLGFNGKLVQYERG